MASLLIVSLWTSLPSAAGASERSRPNGLDRMCASAGPLRAERLPSKVAPNDCLLVGRKIVSGDVSLRVPVPGKGIGAAAVGTGSESELYIHTSRKGVVTIAGSDYTSYTASASSLLLGPAPAEPCDEMAIPGCLPPCDTNSHSINPSRAKVKKGQPWRFRAATTPGTLTTTYALNQIKAGTKNVVNVKNTCGLPDVVPKTSAYKGTTTAKTGMSVSGTTINCGSGNGKNTVEFGNLPSTVLGFACTRTQRIGNNPWFIIEGDIRLKSTAAWTTTINDPGCSDSFDIQSVMMHERTHAFGVGHAEGIVEHSQLTMYPSAYPCNSYGRTFGKGDHTALKKLY